MSLALSGLSGISAITRVQNKAVSLLGQTAPVLPAQFAGAGVLYDLAVKIKSTVDGQIIGVRYYRSPGDVGTHTGFIWSTAGVLLTSVVFSNETASGWQSQLLGTPIVLPKETIIVAAVNSNEYFPQTPNFFDSTATSSPLVGVADRPNGVYSEVLGTFPTLTFSQSNYSRDILFIAD